MYYIYGVSVPSLLIESTDSMIILYCDFSLSERNEVRGTLVTGGERAVSISEWGDLVFTIII